MHIYQIAEDTKGIVLDFITGEELEWSTRIPLTFSDEDLVFDRVRMSNGQVRERDWSNFGRIQRWCEQCYMGFVPHEDGVSHDFMLIIKETDVTTVA